MAASQEQTLQLDEKKRRVMEDLGLTEGDWRPLLILPFFDLELLKQKEMHSRAINREPENNWVRSSLPVNQRIIVKTTENLTKVFYQIFARGTIGAGSIGAVVESLLAIEASELEQEQLLLRGISLLSWYLAEEMNDGDRDALFTQWEEIIKQTYRHQPPEAFHLALRNISQRIERHQKGEDISEADLAAPEQSTQPPEERLLEQWKIVSSRIASLDRYEREQALKEIRIRLCEVDSRPLPYDVELALTEITHLARQLTNLVLAEAEEESEKAGAPDTMIADISEPLPPPQEDTLDVTMELEVPVVPPPPGAPEPPPVQLVESPLLNHTSWSDLQAHIADLSTVGLEDIVGLPLFLDNCRAESRSVAIVQDVDQVPRSLWMVGDLHGDPVALHYAWHYILAEAEKAGEQPYVIFLGDFIDRGPYSHETMIYLFDLIRKYPRQIAVLPGNHDEELSWDEEGGRFRSRVVPAEYVTDLNGILDQGAPLTDSRIKVGRAAIDFFQHRSRAIILPDGLLLAHAGFPHTDLHDNLLTPADLSDERCLQDFVWLRLSPTAARKRPNRGHRGCDFGYEDFNHFCEIMSNRLNIKVTRFLRGHDHEPERYRVYSHYATNPVLTLNTMCRRLEDESGPQYPLACVARHQFGALPEVHQLTIAQEVAQQAFESRSQVNFNEPETGGSSL